MHRRRDIAWELDDIILAGDSWRRNKMVYFHISLWKIWWLAPRLWHIIVITLYDRAGSIQRQRKELVYCTYRRTSKGKRRLSLRRVRTTVEQFVYHLWNRVPLCLFLGHNFVVTSTDTNCSVAKQNFLVRSFGTFITYLSLRFVTET